MGNMLHTPDTFSAPDDALLETSRRSVMNSVTAASMRGNRRRGA